jgi:hypothetical protein
MINRWVLGIFGSFVMKYPAASNGVSIGIFIIALRGGELNPCMPLAD